MGKKLTLAHFVKYLRVLLDEHLKWAKQVTQVKIKLNREIGILSEIQNITNRNTLKMIYHFFFFFFFFGFHLHYGPQLWGKTNIEKQKKLKNSKTDQSEKSFSKNTTATILDQLLRNSWTYLYSIQRPIVHDHPNTIA